MTVEEVDCSFHTIFLQHPGSDSLRGHLCIFTQGELDTSREIVDVQGFVRNWIWAGTIGGNHATPEWLTLD